MQKTILKLTVLVMVLFSLTGCVSTRVQYEPPNEEELLSIAKEVAAMFDYYNEMKNPALKAKLDPQKYSSL